MPLKDRACTHSLLQGLLYATQPGTGGNATNARARPVDLVPHAQKQFTSDIHIGNRRLFQSDRREGNPFGMQTYGLRGEMVEMFTEEDQQFGEFEAGKWLNVTLTQHLFSQVQTDGARIAEFGGILKNVGTTVLFREVKELLYKQMCIHRVLSAWLHGKADPN